MAELIDTGGVFVVGHVPSRWRRVVVALALGFVALAVVGMHQLSLGHVVVTSAEPATGSHAHTAGAHAAGGAASSAAVGPAAEDGCTGCGDHVMPSVCLLALTLLVLFWWLRRPPRRRLPPRRRRVRPSAPPLRRRSRTRALSLPELSVLRT